MKSGCWNRVVLILLFVLSSSPPCYALLGAGDIVFDPQAFQQMLIEYSVQIDQYRNQVQQYQALIQQVQMQRQNLQSLGYKNDLSDLHRIQGVMNSATGISNNFATMQRQFQQLYPEFAAYNNQRGVDYATQAEKWSRQNHQNALDMLTMTTKLHESIAQDQQTLRYLSDRSSSASGTKDLLQNMNQLLILQNKQLMQLQQLISTTAKADAAYMAQKASNDGAANAYGENALKDSNKPGSRTVNHGIFDVLHY